MLQSNVEGRIQTLNENPHENGVSVISSVDTGSVSRGVESCSFVTGGYDKSVVNIVKGGPEKKNLICN